LKRVETGQHRTESKRRDDGDAADGSQPGDWS
jgi:hypothetical protein